MKTRIFPIPFVIRHPSFVILHLSFFILAAAALEAAAAPTYTLSGHGAGFTPIAAPRPVMPRAGGGAGTTFVLGVPTAPTLNISTNSTPPDNEWLEWNPWLSPMGISAPEGGTSQVSDPRNPQLVLASAEGAFPFERSKPDLYLGDPLAPPEGVDWTATFAAFQAAATNGAEAAESSREFLFDLDGQRVFAVLGGQVAFSWVLDDGTTLKMTYNVSPSCSGRPRRIYWTDHPYNAPAVDLSGKFVKFFGPAELLEPEYATVTNVVAGISQVLNDKIVSGLVLDPTTHMLFAYGELQGQVVMAYYETGTFEKIHHVQVVEICRPVVNRMSGAIGRALEPNGRGYATEGLHARPTVVSVNDNRGDYYYQHMGQQSYSPKHGNVYPLRPTMDCPWNMEVYWMETDEMLVDWPFELDQYACDWPEDTTVFVRGDANGDGGRPVYVPHEYTATLMKYQDPEGHARAVESDGTFTTTGEGFSLLQLTANDNVWFVPVRSVWRTDRKFFTLEADDLPVGRELELRGGEAAGTAGGFAPKCDPSSPGYVYAAASAPVWNPNLYQAPHPDNDAAAATNGLDAVTGEGDTNSYASVVYTVSPGTVEVWWNTVLQEEDMPSPVVIPTLPQVYSTHWPGTGDAPQIVLASQLGSAGESVFSHNAAIYLAETSSVVNLPPRKCFDAKKGGTLMFWVSAETGLDANAPVLGLSGESGSWSVTAGQIGLGAGSGWHHVAVAFTNEGSGVVAYVDGKKTGTPFGNAPDLTGAYSVTLGRSGPEDPAATPGLAFGEILLWNRTLTEKRIAEEMHKTHTGLESGLRSCYVFVDGVDLEVTGNGTRRFTERVQGRICGATNCLMELLGPPAAGTGVIEADEGTTAEVYVQNDPAGIGYNPNEEHAIVLAGSGGWVAWALRCDLNMESSSAPGVLVEYAKGGRKAMQWFGVVATNAAYPKFAAPCVAGKAFPGPHPIDFFDDPWCPSNKWDNPSATAPAFRDRKGQLWARCAGDSTNRMYYRNQEGFAYPSLDPANWPAVNAEIPWLALLRRGPTNNPLSVTARPHPWVWHVAWPDNVPQMEIGRTLTTAADGLPEVWNAKSCAIVWPQSPDERTQLYPGTQVVGFDATNTVTNLLVQFGITTDTCTFTNEVWYFNKSVPPPLGDRFWFDPRADVTACLRLDGDRSDKHHMLSADERATLMAAVNDAAADAAAKTLWTNAISQLLLDSDLKPPRAILFDPTVAQTAGFPSNNAVGDLVAKFGIKSGAGGHATLRKGKWYFDDLPPNLSSRFYLDTSAPVTSCLKLVGEREDNPGGVALLHVNVLSPAERELIAGLVDDTAEDQGAKTLWHNAISNLAVNSVCPSVLSSSANDEPKVSYYPRDHYALFSMGQIGYVTLIENDSTNEMMNVSPGDPVSMHVFQVVPKYYTGRVVTREDPYNLLSQQLSVIYEEAFAGDPNEYEFEWRKARPPTNGRVPTDFDDSQVYTLKFPLTNGLTRFVIGGQGDTLQNMVNTYYAMRYRAASSNSPSWATMGDAWSDWTDPPALAEGWVQRVLNNVTPFAQRMRDFEENEAETAISMLRQAGAPYEGDVALNQDNLESVGLIQLYETILSKAESMSLALGIADADANKQLQLAAARLADLYAVLGDEAYTDALNPTIGFGGDFRTESIDYGALSSALFCFDNQVPTLLDEELALLRGRTAENAPSTRLSPYYNRLVWNLTKSPVGGEVAYMVNYDITDDGDGDGLLDHKDAARLFPQGHGDAYGHYLSALSGWYRLLRNPYFSWGPPAMGEMVVADSVVNVDYYDEAKFAKSAYDVAKTAALVVDRTARKAIRDNAGAPGAGYLDKDSSRAFGWGEWASRGGFGALANWAVGNALLPEQPDPGRYWRLAFTNGASLTAEVDEDDATAVKLSSKKAWTVEFQLVADPDATAGGTVFLATGPDNAFCLELGSNSVLSAWTLPCKSVVLTNFSYMYSYTNAESAGAIAGKAFQVVSFPNGDGSKALECDFYATNAIHVSLPVGYNLEAELAAADGTNSWPAAPQWPEWTLVDFRDEAAAGGPVLPTIRSTILQAHRPDWSQTPVETTVGAVPRGHDVLVAVRNPGGDESKPVVTLFDDTGAKIAETELDFPVNLSPSTLALGGFDGEIAEFRVWNGTRRTDDELLEKRECVSPLANHLTVYLRTISPTPGAPQIASDVSGIVWELAGAHWISAEECGVEIAFEDEGLDRIDRSTVPELASLASLIPDIQFKVDRLDAGLGPLGLASGAMPFDLTPINAGDGGKTHYEQIRERAGTALENARQALEKAQEYGSRIRLLRETEDGWEAANAATELETKNKLIEYFGYPYEGDIGPSGSYPQGYDGPDIYNYAWMEPQLYGLKDDEDVKSVTTNIYVRDSSKFRDGLAVLLPNFYDTKDYATFVYEKSASGLILKPASVTGKRRAQGKIQEKMGDFLVAYRDFKGALGSWEGANAAFEYQVGLIIRDEVFHEMKNAAVALQNVYAFYRSTQNAVLKACINNLETIASTEDSIKNTVIACSPKISGAGTTVNVDPSSIVAAASLPIHLVSESARAVALLTAKNALISIDAVQTGFDLAVWEIDTLIEYMTTFDNYYARAKQAASAVSSAATACRDAYVQLEAAQAALEAVCAEAERVIDERTLARKQAANVLTKARYNEMFFRLARNNALSRYDAQFELAQKYAWLAAQAYDYETGLISADRASGEAFLARIIGARTLGEFDSSGNPMAASDAAKGDGGLAAILAEMDANWAVLKPRLGINNPQPYATWFSLRHDLFRILEGEKGDKTWRNTLQKYMVDDLNQLAEFAHYCQPLAGSAAEKEPGLVIPFPSVIAAGLNFFGNPLEGGDASLDPTWYATHVSAAGVHFVGYDPVNLSRTPSAYLVPVGEDRMRAVGDPGTVISWKIVDQTIPAPYAIGSTQLDDPDWTPLFDGNTGGNDLGARIRKHPSFRAYYAGTNEAPSDASLDCTRLVGRSAWNTRWLLVIPASSLAADRESALAALINGVDVDRDGSPDASGVADIQIGFKTYSTSGN
jgi:hypothetical protein